MIPQVGNRTEHPCAFSENLVRAEIIDVLGVVPSENLVDIEIVDVFGTVGQPAFDDAPALATFLGVLRTLLGPELHSRLRSSPFVTSFSSSNANALEDGFSFGPRSHVLVLALARLVRSRARSFSSARSM